PLGDISIERVLPWWRRNAGFLLRRRRPPKRWRKHRRVARRWWCCTGIDLGQDRVAERDCFGGRRGWIPRGRSQRAAHLDRRALDDGHPPTWRRDIDRAVPDALIELLRLQELHEGHKVA